MKFLVKNPVQKSNKRAFWNNVISSDGVIHSHFVKPNYTESIFSNTEGSEASCDWYSALRESNLIFKMTTHPIL